jgi:Ca2+-binding RTX toxin-like protein
MPFNAPTMGTASTGTFVSNTFSDTFDVGGNEVNMIALDLTEGQFYEIDIDNGVAGDFYLRIFDQFGTEVRANDDGFYGFDNVVFSLSPYLRFTPNYTGRYYVAVSPWYLDSYDPTSTTGRVGGENPLPLTAGALTVNLFSTSNWGSSGAISAISAEGVSDLTDMVRDTDGSMRVEVTGLIDTFTDLDMSRIDLAKGDVVVVDVNGALTGTTIGTVLRVFDASGAQIGFDDDSGVGEDSELIFNAPSTGSYFVGITAEGNSAYNALDGTGIVNGVATGAFEVIVHRNPTLVGSSLGNTISGSGLSDYIVGLSGNDTILGGDGNDTLAGGDDNDDLNGGNGNDILYGEHGHDILNGFGGNDVIVGGLGNDTIAGGGGNDVLEGGTGDDSLSGSIGVDTLRGGDGIDNLIGAEGSDVLDGGNGNDTVNGGVGSDLMDGGAGEDNMLGGSGIDTMNGGSENDTLNGGGDSDILDGGSGNDTLLGSSGNDRLAGGLGIDTLSGQSNDDVFVFADLVGGLDTITDFIVSGGDTIDLSAIFDATGSVVTGANLAQFVQTSPSGPGTDSFLAVDADGAVGGLSFTIVAQVNGVTAAQLFDVNNFIL